MNEQVEGQLTLFPEDSHANLTAWLEKDLERKTNEICGQNLCGLSDSLSREPLWVKMCLEYYLPYMKEFAPIWRRKVTKSKRCVFRLMLSVRTMRDTGWLLLPSTRASQDK